MPVLSNITSVPTITLNDNVTPLFHTDEHWKRLAEVDNGSSGSLLDAEGRFSDADESTLARNLTGRWPHAYRLPKADVDVVAGLPLGALIVNNNVNILQSQDRLRPLSALAPVFQPTDHISLALGTSLGLSKPSPAPHIALPAIVTPTPLNAFALPFTPATAGAITQSLTATEASSPTLSDGAESVADSLQDAIDALQDAIHCIENVPYLFDSPPPNPYQSPVTGLMPSDPMDMLGPGAISLPIPRAYDYFNIVPSSPVDGGWPSFRDAASFFPSRCSTLTSNSSSALLTPTDGSFPSTPNDMIFVTSPLGHDATVTASRISTSPTDATSDAEEYQIAVGRDRAIVMVGPVPPGAKGGANRRRREFAVETLRDENSFEAWFERQRRQRTTADGAPMRGPLDETVDSERSFPTRRLVKDAMSYQVLDKGSMYKTPVDMSILFSPGTAPPSTSSLASTKAVRPPRCCESCGSVISNFGLPDVEDLRELPSMALEVYTSPPSPALFLDDTTSSAHPIGFPKDARSAEQPVVGFTFPTPLLNVLPHAVRLKIVPPTPVLLPTALFNHIPVLEPALPTQVATSEGPFALSTVIMPRTLPTPPWLPDSSAMNDGSTHLTRPISNVGINATRARLNFTPTGTTPPSTARASPRGPRPLRTATELKSYRTLAINEARVMAITASQAQIATKQERVPESHPTRLPFYPLRGGTGKLAVPEYEDSIAVDDCQSSGSSVEESNGDSVFEGDTRRVRFAPTALVRLFSPQSRTPFPLPEPSRVPKHQSPAVGRSGVDYDDPNAGLNAVMPLMDKTQKMLREDPLNLLRQRTLELAREDTFALKGDQNRMVRTKLKPSKTGPLQDVLCAEPLLLTTPHSNTYAPPSSLISKPTSSTTLHTLHQDALFSMLHNLHLDTMQRFSSGFSLTASPPMLSLKSTALPQFLNPMAPVFKPTMLQSSLAAAGTGNRRRPNTVSMSVLTHGDLTTTSGLNPLGIIREPRGPKFTTNGELDPGFFREFAMSKRGLMNIGGDWYRTTEWSCFRIVRGGPLHAKWVVK